MATVACLRIIATNAAAALLATAACVRVNDEVISLPAGPATPIQSRSCKVPPDNLNGTLKECTRRAPPMAFEPRLKWSWSEPDGLKPTNWRGSAHIPLVANLTDDNGDGVVDLCDTPDVVVTVQGEWTLGGHIFVLAGDTGATEFELEGVVDAMTTPAIGDIDGDGVPEIVTLSTVVVGTQLQSQLVFYDNKGRIKLKGGEAIGGGALSIYDLDADGKPEIVVGASDVFDNQGRWLFGRTGGGDRSITDAAADLDGDGKLEVILGSQVFHADGRLAFKISGLEDSMLAQAPGEPLIANFDDDPDPEILLIKNDRYLMVEADGQMKFGPASLAPSNLGLTQGVGAVHDFDGDGKVDIAIPLTDTYGVFGVTAKGLSLKWQAPVQNNTSLAPGTAFDFLGRGHAQAIQISWQDLFVRDGQTGSLDFMRQISAPGGDAYPIVADVDADDSADILVVGSSPIDQPRSTPTLQVFEDAQKRWIPTRRIWNQYNYVVANVREDGTIPRVMPRYWLQNNTVRANAQNENLNPCLPAVIP